MTLITSYNHFSSDSEQKKSTQDKILDSICDDVRQSVPVNAMGPTEKMYFDTNGPVCRPIIMFPVFCFIFMLYVIIRLTWTLVFLY